MGVAIAIDPFRGKLILVLLISDFAGLHLKKYEQIIMFTGMVGEGYT